MELALIVWAISTLPSLAEGFMIIGVMATIFTIFFKVIMQEDFPNKIAVLILVFSLPTWLIGALIPDKDTSYKMLAAYGVQTLAENPTVQELGKDGVDVLKALMAKAKKELETESK